MGSACLCRCSLKHLTYSTKQNSTSYGEWVQCPWHIHTLKGIKPRHIFEQAKRVHSLFNNLTIPDRYSIPQLQDLTASLQPFLTLIWCVRTTRFRGYTKKTAPFGFFECHPFSLRNTAQMFQRFIDEVLHSLHFCFGNLLVASATPEKNLQHFQSVLARLEQHGIVIKVTESVFGVSSLEFLGILMDSTGIRLHEKTIQTLRDFPRPTLLEMGCLHTPKKVYSIHFKNKGVNLWCTLHSHWVYMYI